MASLRCSRETFEKMTDKRDGPDLLRFAWPDTEKRLREFCGGAALPARGEKRLFYEKTGDSGSIQRFYPPLVLCKGRQNLDSEAFLTELQDPEDLGVELYLLFQSGAAALGLFDDGELVRHKVIKKYVVRGKGRAQPSHLKTKGKSRYGSRLRLQNAQSLLEEVSDRLNQWIAEDGTPRVFYLSCPIRLWPELKGVGLSEELQDSSIRQHIPLDVHRPSFEELLRVRAFCETGEIRGDTPSE